MVLSSMSLSESSSVANDDDGEKVARGETTNAAVTFSRKSTMATHTLFAVVGVLVCIILCQKGFEMDVILVCCC